MRLPRWLIVTLLSTSVLAVLGAGMLWWVTWPQRIAQEFCELCRDGRVNEACRLCEPSLADELAQEASLPTNLKVDSPDLVELALGHRQIRAELTMERFISTG